MDYQYLLDYMVLAMSLIVFILSYVIIIGRAQRIADKCARQDYEEYGYHDYDQ